MLCPDADKFSNLHQLSSGIKGIFSLVRSLIKKKWKSILHEFPFPIILEIEKF